MRIPFKSIDYINTNLGISYVKVDDNFGSGSGEGWLYLGKGCEISTSGGDASESAARYIVFQDYLELRNVSDTFFDKGLV